MEKELVNDKINANIVNLINEEGINCGQMVTSFALKMAKDKNLDLVQVSLKEGIPICKIMNYGKWKYEKSKKSVHIAKNDLKEVRIGYNIGEHDLSFKNKQVIKFLEDNFKVKYSLTLKGRERQMVDLGKTKLAEMLNNNFADKATWTPMNIGFGRNNKNRDSTFIHVILTHIKK